MKIRVSEECLNKSVWIYFKIMAINLSYEYCGVVKFADRNLENFIVCSRLITMEKRKC